MRKQLVSGKKLLLFVDTGDNCRCPLAIGYLSKLLAQKNINYIDLRHMGVMTPNDLLPTPEVVQLLKEEGVDIKYHRSRPVNDELIRQADVVLGFTAIHVQTCLRRVPESKGKVHLLKQFVGLAHTGDQIHDPMGSTMEIFKKYFNDIKLSLHKLMETEFITEPPEPKEVVIAPTVSKPRPMANADDEEPPRRSRKADAEAAEPAKAAKAKAKATPEPEPEEEEPAPEAKKKAPAAKAKPPAAKKSAAEPAKASKTKQNNSDEDKPVKATADKKSAKAPAKSDEKKPAAKKSEKAAAPAKTAAAKPEKAAKEPAKPAKKAAAAKTPAAAKPAAKTTKAKK